MLNTSTEVSGTVQGTPMILENCCIFSVEGEEGVYLVLSTDRQAVKDYVFVKEGQSIQIAGNSLKQDNIKGIIVTERAKIEIEKIFEKVKPF